VVAFSEDPFPFFIGGGYILLHFLAYFTYL